MVVPRSFTYGAHCLQNKCDTTKDSARHVYGKGKVVIYFHCKNVNIINDSAKYPVMQSLTNKVWTSPLQNFFRYSGRQKKILYDLLCRVKKITRN